MVAELSAQRGNDVGQVPDDRDVGGADLGDLGGVDVDVDHRGLGGEGVRLAGDPVIEAGSQADDDVGPLQGPDGGHSAVHAGHPQVERVLAGHDVQGGQGGDEGRSDELDELGELLGGNLRPVQPAAQVEDGSLGSGDHLGGLGQAPLVGLARQAVAGKVTGRGPHELGGPLLGILGDVDEDRAGASGGGDVEGLGHARDDVLGTGDEEGVLDEGHRGPDDVGLLEGVRPDSAASDLPGDGQHGHRVHVGVTDGGDEVGGSRAGGGDAHPGATGDHGVSLGGMTSTLLVAHQDVTDLRRGEQGVVEGQDGAARHPEDVCDA